MTTAAAPPELQTKMHTLIQEYGLEACRSCLQVAMDEQQQINQAILQASFDGFFLVNKEGLILSCNQAALHIFGYSEPDELVGNHIMNLVGGDDPASHKRHFEHPPEPIPGSQILTHMRDVPARTKSGMEVRVTVGLCFVELANGGRHYVAFVRDLTKQQRQDELQRATFNASYDPIVVTNAEGVIQTVNQAMLEEFRYKESAILGESIAKLVPQGHGLMMEHFRQHVQHTDSSSQVADLRNREMTAVRTDGSTFPIKMAFQRIKADHIHDLHLVGFIRNISSDQKAMQVTRMEAEVRAQQARVELERDMMAYYEHELKNPLGIVDSALTTMPQEFTNTNQQEVQELLQSIRLCVTFMTNILNNLLDVRLMEEGRMHLCPRPLDLEQLLKEVHTMLLPSVVSKGVQFRCNVDVGKRNWVLGDAHRLQQVLSHICSDSIKYTTTGSISLSLAWSDERLVRFECKDTRPGISIDEQAHLFERFVKRGGAPGTGLGLAIAKHIVDYMGGTIRFECDPAVAPGSKCIALLPLPVAEPPPKGDKSSLDSTKKDVEPILETLKVLVVDDIKLNRKMVSRRLKKIAPNCSISEACTGEEAIKICQQETSFDVIIMDNYMDKAGGVMVGTDAVVTLRSMGIGALIIGCSGNDLEQEFQSAGAQFFWSKPLPPDAEIVRQIRVGLELAK